MTPICYHEIIPCGTQQVLKAMNQFILLANITPDDFNNRDVVRGKGSGVNDLDGNVKFRTKLIGSRKDAYAVTLDKKKMDNLALEVLYEIRAVGGRFLVLNQETRRYDDEGDKKALRKIKQALREGQAARRARLIKKGRTMLPAEQEVVNMITPPESPVMAALSTSMENVDVLRIPSPAPGDSVLGVRSFGEAMDDSDDEDFSADDATYLCECFGIDAPDAQRSKLVCCGGDVTNPVTENPVWAAFVSYNVYHTTQDNAPTLERVVNSLYSDTCSTGAFDDLDMEIDYNFFEEL